MKHRERRLPMGWYPSDSRGVQSDIEGFLATPPDGQVAGQPRHGIVPHAGWYFSGRAAAHVFDAVATRGPAPDTIVVYGGHLGGGERPIVYDYDQFETPAGDLTIDRELTLAIMDRLETRAEGSHGDNTVEVQVAMVKHFFPDAQFMAVHAPSDESAMALGQAVAEAAAQLGRAIATFGAADLTHYGASYGFAPKGHGAEAVAWVKEDNDREIVDLTLRMDAPGALESAERRHNCCSAGAVAATIATAQAQGATRAALLDYYTSYDVDPGRNIVGYMGVAFCEG